LRVHDAHRWPVIGVRLALGVFLLGILVIPGRTHAGQSTPSPRVAEPGDCTVEPRPFPIWDGTPPTRIETAPVTSAGPFVPPEGQAVDKVVVEGITATVEESIACTNSGEIRRVLSLFSDNRVRAFFVGRGAPAPSEIESILSQPPTPVPEDRRLTLMSIQDVRLLPDGRAGAIIETRSDDTVFLDFVFFVEEDGRWLIDDSVAIDSSTQVGATPSA
jgi:hypothetical protein